MQISSSGVLNVTISTGIWYCKNMIIKIFDQEIWNIKIHTISSHSRVSISKKMVDRLTQSKIMYWDQVMGGSFVTLTFKSVDPEFVRRYHSNKPSLAEHLDSLIYFLGFYEIDFFFGGGGGCLGGKILLPNQADIQVEQVALVIPIVCLPHFSFYQLTRFSNSKFVGVKLIWFKQMILMNMVKITPRGLWREAEENRPKIFIPCVWSRKWK